MTGIHGDGLEGQYVCYERNRIFPESDEGAVTEHMASQIMGDIAGADFCLDIHASNIFLREILQVRMSEGMRITSI